VRHLFKSFVLFFFFLKNFLLARHWWLTPVILATQEAEIRRISVQSQHEQISQKNPSHKRAGLVAQGVGPEFKPQYSRKKKRIKCQPEILSSRPACNTCLKKQKQNKSPEGAKTEAILDRKSPHSWFLYPSTVSILETAKASF
jgi:hypothetical protein